MNNSSDIFPTKRFLFYFVLCFWAILIDIHEISQWDWIMQVLRCGTYIWSTSKTNLNIIISNILHTDQAHKTEQWLHLQHKHWVEKFRSTKFRLEKEVPDKVEMAKVSGSRDSRHLQLEPRPSQWCTQEVHISFVFVTLWRFLDQRSSPHL